jgi:hypothetical protein
VNASNWSAAVARHSAGIASAISGFSGGAATSREGGSEGTVSVSASGWSTVWRAEGVVPRPQYSSFFGFPGRPGYQHSRPSMMR